MTCLICVDQYIKSDSPTLVREETRFRGVSPRNENMILGEFRAELIFDSYIALTRLRTVMNRDELTKHKFIIHNDFLNTIDLRVRHLN